MTIEPLRYGAVLPNLIFFNPKPRFLKAVKPFVKDHHVIDCGAGVGRTSRLLDEIGIKVSAIDLHLREEPEYPVSLFDATKFPFRNHHIALIARPNRGVWIHEVIRKAISNGAEVIYVGVNRNFAGDLDLPYEVESICKNAGDDHEEAFIIRSKTES